MVTAPAVKLAAVPSQLVKVPEVGVPNAGVTNVGELANTRLPVPVSSLIKVAKFADVDDAKTLMLSVV